MIFFLCYKIKSRDTGEKNRNNKKTHSHCTFQSSNKHSIAISSSLWEYPAGDFENIMKVNVS